MSTTPETYKNSGTCRSCGATGPHSCKGLQFKQAPSLGDFKARLAELSSTLEAKLKDVSDEMENNTELDEYHFDAGFTAGLRVALNDLAKLSESL